MRIEIWDGNKLMVCIEGWQIPEGATLRECYETEDEIIVCGFPKENDENHNCDMMGCSTVNHILYRFKIEDNA